MRVLLTWPLLHNWKITQLYYVLVFPKVLDEKAFEMEEGTKEKCLSQLQRNDCTQKQAGQVQNKYIVGKIVNELKFIQCIADESYIIVVPLYIYLIYC